MPGRNETSIFLIFPLGYQFIFFIFIPVSIVIQDEIYVKKLYKICIPIPTLYIRQLMKPNHII